MPGSATLARKARHNTPERCTWMRPVVRSEETQKNGLGSSSMQISPKCSRSRLETFLPRTMAISGKVKSDSGLVSTKASRMRAVSSSMPHSEAIPAAMIAPIEVPPR